MRCMKSMSRSVVASIIAGACTLLSGVAHAHTPYLIAVSDEAARGGVVSLDASFAETFFAADAAFDNSEFFVVQPDGSRAEPEQLVTLKTRTVAEVALTQEGTYRISTGMRQGAVFTFFKHEGKDGRVMGLDAPIPEGAVVTQQFQSLTQADTYVSYKTTSDKALKVDDKGLQIEPLKNPSTLFPGQVFAVRVLLNGEPVKALELSLYHACRDGSKKPVVLTTDDNGVASLTLAKGRYLLRARKRVAAPESAKVPLYSYTTTLSFDVFKKS
ncbi:MAG: hypothetical protein CR978_00365 [Gammaproteobacteria bacterium]|nr:MAG: hypothetical protein CR978_00365 [Gammaproteobacteria bacterium]